MAKIGGIDSMKKLWKTALKPVLSSLANLQKTGRNTLDKNSMTKNTKP
jgi:hypothetical protein